MYMLILIMCLEATIVSLVLWSHLNEAQIWSIVAVQSAALFTVMLLITVAVIQQSKYWWSEPPDNNLALGHSL